MRRVGSAIVLSMLVLTACGGEDPQSAGGTPGPKRSNPPPRVFAASLERFDACPPLVDHLRTEARKRVGPYGLPGGFGGGVAVALEAGTAARGGASADSAAPAPAAPSYSSTNVQEASVDEPDTVKTDGRHIFTLRTDPADQQRQRLTSISVGGDAPRLTGDVLLPEGFGYQLMLTGDRVLAMGQKGGYGIAIDSREFAPGPSAEQATVVAIVDVSDPANMRVVNTLDLEGNYSSARMVGGVARIVVNSAQSDIPFVSPTEPTVTSEKKALAQNTRLINSASTDAWLPNYTLQDASGDVTAKGTLASCSTTYHPKSFSGFGTVSVVTLDPRNPDPQRSAAIVGTAGTVYASADNLYIATQRWPDVQPLVLEDRPVGAPAPVPAPAKTELHRFDISDATRAVYAASGEVRGTVLNQWSLSEHEGHFRVATTEEGFGAEGPSSSASFITVLSASGNELKKVASIDNIAPGERIYGVRFIQDVGYVVTFKQIDPLHVVDLSTPSKPRILGELKIPGYSAYLHPVGDGFLLGIGQDATEDGRPIGTVVSLFDVRDPSKPTRLDKVTIVNGHSPVEYDHHAFTWWAPSKLAIVPVETYDIEKANQGNPAQQSRAYAYRVDGGSIVPAGRVSHASHLPSGAYDLIERSIVVGDVLYTLSAAGLMASDLGTLRERGWVKLSDPPRPDQPTQVEPQPGQADPQPAP